MTYFAAKTPCQNGHVHASRKEAKHCNALHLLAAIIATEGPVPVSDVRKVLNIAPRKWGLPLDRLGFMFVISDGIVDLNDYAFVSEDGAE